MTAANKHNWKIHRSDNLPIADCCISSSHLPSSAPKYPLRFLFSEYFWQNTSGQILGPREAMEMLLQALVHIQYEEEVQRLNSLGCKPFNFMWPIHLTSCRYHSQTTYNHLWKHKLSLLWRRWLVQLQFSHSTWRLDIWDVHNAINPGELGKPHGFSMT